MKKLIVVLIVAALLISSLAGCSSTKFKMDSQHLKYGEKALEYLDSFLDFDISLSELDEKFDSLYSAIDSLPSVSKDDECYYGNYFVESKVTNLHFHLSLASYKNNSSEILQRRNDLAEILGKPAR